MLHILDIPIFDSGLDSAVEKVFKTCTNSDGIRNRLVSATSAHGLVFAKKKNDFANTLRAFFLNLPDGLPLVWVGRLKGSRYIQRCYGPDFFAEVLRQTATSSVRHFFCGGKKGVAEQLKVACEDKFQNRNCVGTFSPPFRDMTDDEFVSLGRMIINSGADIVWIGMSTPKQEIFAKKLANYISVCFIITVGAAFDFHTGRLRQAPRFLQRVGLEWFFRLIMEPRRLFSRYLIVVPLFPYYAVKDLLGSGVVRLKTMEKK